MPRKRVRSTTSYLDEKLTSLCKKAQELSIISDVKVGVISVTLGEPEFAWPSLTEAKNIVNDYLAFPVSKGPPKVVKHEGFLKDLVKKREEEIRILEEIAEEKEMENLFNQLSAGKKYLDQLNVKEMKDLLKLFAVKRVKVEQRKIQINENVTTEIIANDNNTGKENDGHP